MNRLFLVFVIIFLTSCLRTRSDIGVSNLSASFPVATKSEQKAPLTRVQEQARLKLQLQESQQMVRNLTGRVEALEKRIEKDAAQTNLREQLERKLDFYDKALLSLDKKISDMAKKKKLKRKKRKKKKTSKKKTSKKKTSKKKSDYQMGQDYFAEKNWKGAIFAFQKYREKNIKGKKYEEVTFKIGVSFQNLGLTEEGSIFFDEIITRAPDSQFAKKAKNQLKKLQ